MEKNIIANSVDFFKSISKYTIIDNYIFSSSDQSIYIDSTTFPDEGLTFYNCTFDKNIKFFNCDFKSGLKFNNCSFKDVTFNQCESNHFDEYFNDHKTNIEFINCKIVKLKIERECKFQFGFFIEGEETEIEKIFIEELTTNKVELRNVKISGSEIGLLNFNKIHVSSIEEKFDIINTKINNFEIRNSEIQASFSFLSSLSGQLQFINTTFYSNLRFSSFKINEMTIDENCHFKENFYLLNGLNKHFILNLYNSYYAKDFQINNIAIYGILISDCTFGNFLFSDIKETINYFELRLSDKLTGFFEICFVIIVKLKLRADNNKAKILFHDAKIKNLLLENLENESLLKFNNVSALDKDSIIDISNSNLGKTTFFNFDFSSFKTINIESSILNEIITSNVKWFKSSQLIADNQNKREVFRQLKYASEKQSNKIDALMFNAYEMHEFHNELVIDSKKELQPDESLKNINNRISLFAGMTNDFGQNWIKPVTLLLLFTLFFYPFYVVGLSDEISFGFNFCPENIKITKKVFGDNLKLIPQILDITHSLSKMKVNGSIGNLLYFIDFIYKLMLAFFIFQTISAFRKYFVK